jgi:hypothetical protein
MDDIAELVDNLNEIIKIQGNMIEKLTIKLLEYMEIEDIDKMMDGKEEVERLLDRWKT